MHDIRLVSAAAVAALIVAPSAVAGSIDLNVVAAAARQPVMAGWANNTATIEAGEDGERVIRVTLPNGFKYVIVNDQCVTPGTPPTGCERLGFVVVYGEAAGAPTLEALNGWNSNRPPQAFTSEGRTYMVHYVFARDGMSAVNATHNLEFWNNSLVAFDQYGSAAAKEQTISVSADDPPTAHDFERRPWFDHGAIGRNDVNDSYSLRD